MTTITIYKLRSGFLNIQDNFSLEAGHMDEEKGDYPIEVELPDGFTVSNKNALSKPEIYDAHNNHYSLTSDERGHPWISGPGGRSIRLRESAE
jgi:hypothetical protein